MDEALRHEIVQRHQAGVKQRQIARELGISRGAVARVLARWHAARARPKRAGVRAAPGVAVSSTPTSRCCGSCWPVIPT